MGGCGGLGGGARCASSACPSPGGAGRAPPRTPVHSRAPPSCTAPRPWAPRPGERRLLEKKSSPELRPRPPERLSAPPPPLALFSRSRIPSAMLQPGGRGASGSPARAQLPPRSSRPRRRPAARRGPPEAPAASPRLCPPAAPPPQRWLQRGTVSGLLRGTARPAPSPGGRPPAARPLPGRLPSSLSLPFRPPPRFRSRPASAAPGAPRPAPTRGLAAREGSPGRSPTRLCVPAPEPELPRAPRPGSGGGTAGSAGSSPGCEQAGERARPTRRPPARTHPCQSQHAALARPRAPETLPRPPARPQRCLGPCVARCTAMAVRAGSIRSLLTLSALVTLLSTQPRPHWLPPSQPPHRLVETLPLS